MGLVGAGKSLASASHTQRVGDIVTFEKPASGKESGLGVEMIPVTVRRAAQSGGTCVLNPAIMAGGRGSLLVHGFQPGEDGGSYRVLWRGGSTAGPAEDCGPEADLIVGEAALRLLAGSAWELKHPEFTRMISQGWTEFL